MGKIDIVILIILGIFTIVGLAKGFVKQILSTANLLVAIILAIVCVKPVSVALSDTIVSTKINSALVEYISGKGESFNSVIEEGTTTETLTAAIDGLGLPGFVDKMIVNSIKVDEASYGLTVSEFLSEKLGALLLVAVSFLALVIAIFIVMKILIHFIDSAISNSKGLSGINKLLGMILGLAKGIIVVSLLMLALSALGGFFGGINDFINADLNLGAEGFSIARYFYEKNPVLWLLENVIDLDSIIASLKPTASV